MKKILYTMGAMLALLGCTRNESVEIESSAAIFSTSSAMTRVVSSAEASTWESGDPIGISSDLGDSNVKYIATKGESSTTFAFDDDDETAEILLPRTGTATYSAYYPYQGAEATCFTSQISDTQSDLGAIDFLVATGSEGSEGGSDVKFEFKHALSMLHFSIELSDEISDNYPLAEESLSDYLMLIIDGAATTASYSFTGEYNSGSSTGASILPVIDNTSATAAAIINPITDESEPVEQTLTLTARFYDSSGDSPILVKTYTQEIKLTAVANYIYKYKIVLGNDKMSISGTPTIVDWSDYNFGSEEAEDYSNELGTLEEIE